MKYGRDGVSGGTPCLYPLTPLVCLGKREEECEARDDRRCCKHAAVPGISMPGKQGHANNEFEECVEVVRPVECFAGGIKYPVVPEGRDIPLSLLTLMRDMLRSSEIGPIQAPSLKYRTMNIEKNGSTMRTSTPRCTG